MADKMAAAYQLDVASDVGGGFPLNISPLPTVQNSSKIIHSQNQFTHEIFTIFFERPAITYLIYVDNMDVSHLKN